MILGMAQWHLSDEGIVESIQSRGAFNSSNSSFTQKLIQAWNSKIFNPNNFFWNNEFFWVVTYQLIEDFASCRTECHGSETRVGTAKLFYLWGWVSPFKICNLFVLIQPGHVSHVDGDWKRPSHAEVELLRIETRYSLNLRSIGLWSCIS